MAQYCSTMFISPWTRSIAVKKECRRLCGEMPHHGGDYSRRLDLCERWSTPGLWPLDRVPGLTFNPLGTGRGTTTTGNKLALTANIPFLTGLIHSCFFMDVWYFDVCSNYVSFCRSTMMQFHSLAHTLPYSRVPLLKRDVFLCNCWSLGRLNNQA